MIVQTCYFKTRFLEIADQKLLKLAISRVLLTKALKEYFNKKVKF